MRIFLTLHPSANLSVPGSMTWYHNIYEPLLDLGHEVILLRMDEVAKSHKIPFRSKRFKEVFSEELLRVFKYENAKKPFSFFLSYVTNQDIDPDVLKLIKNSNCPLANFSCNNTHQFNLVKDISPFFEYNLHSEKDAEARFRETGANPVWFPMGANPKYYFPVRSIFKYDTSFIGSAYGKRSFYINHLVQNGIKVDCFGPNWLINKPYPKLKNLKKEAIRFSNLLKLVFQTDSIKRYKISSTIQNYDLLKALRDSSLGYFHYPVSDIEMISVINQSKTNLGFLEVFNYDDESWAITKQHVHLRDFEIPMCGGLYITNYMQELEEFYELDKEIIIFRNEYELADKIRFYLNNDKAATMIRNAAFKRAVKFHTYQRRFQDLFKKLSL